MKLTFAGLLALTFCAFQVASAQDAKTAAPVPGTVVTGRVIFADTNGPARFSKVFLKSAAPPDAADNPFAALLSSPPPPRPGSTQAPAKPSAPKLSAEDQAEKNQQMAAATKMMAALSDLLVSTTVGVDGVYTFTNVKPGTYYVHAQVPGYIDPMSDFSADQLTSTDPAVRAKIAAVVPMVTVSGTSEGHADLRLERGAAITGRVLYDDGTPAVGWTVKVVRNATPGANGFEAMGLDASDVDLSHLTQMAQTDDTGHYRLAGLESGEYVLQARFVGPPLGHSSLNPIVTNKTSSPFASSPMAGMMGLKLTVYSGNVMRLADAKAVSVKSGEERTGYDLAMPIHSMHAVNGLVRGKADGRAVNGGSVELMATGADGKDDPASRLLAQVQGDGTFHFDYVPGNTTYTLKVTHAVQATTTETTKILGSTMAEQKTTHRYGPMSQSVIVGDSDVSDLRLDVPEVAPESAS